MLEDIIDKGVLEMAEGPFKAVAQMASWSDILSVRILVLLSIVLFLVFAMDIVSVLPKIIDCVVRSKANLSLEHSVSNARVRNEVCSLMLVPFCLIVDRFNLYAPSFVNAVRPGLSVFCIMGVFVAYLLLRLILFFIFKPLRLNAEFQATVRHIPFNFFIALVILTLVTSGILSLFPVPDGIIRRVLLWETAFFYLMSIIRTYQFLSPRCNFFATFLYLCALEFLPTGLLIASEFVL